MSAKKNSLFWGLLEIPSSQAIWPANISKENNIPWVFPLSKSVMYLNENNCHVGKIKKKSKLRLPLSIFLQNHVLFLRRHFLLNVLFLHKWIYDQALIVINLLKKLFYFYFIKTLFIQYDSFSFRDKKRFWKMFICQTNKFFFF